MIDEMEKYLVDTNLWSEGTKNEPDERVITWMRDHESVLYISTISIGELKYGIERLEDGRRKRAYQSWLTGLTQRMKGRILNYNTSAANVWGQLQAKCEIQGITLPSLDSQIAAIAIRHGLIIASRNESDFRHTGVKVINPFSK